MQKDLVFFKKEGEEGVALTSTSANHIVEVALVGTLADANIIQTGESSEVLDSLQ